MKKKVKILAEQSWRIYCVMQMWEMKLSDLWLEICVTKGRGKVYVEESKQILVEDWKQLWHLVLVSHKEYFELWAGKKSWEVPQEWLAPAEKKSKRWTAPAVRSCSILATSTTTLPNLWLFHNAAPPCNPSTWLLWWVLHNAALLQVAFLATTSPSYLPHVGNTHHHSFQTVWLLLL